MLLGTINLVLHIYQHPSKRRYYTNIIFISDVNECRLAICRVRVSKRCACDNYYSKAKCLHFQGTFDDKLTTQPSRFW